MTIAKILIIDDDATYRTILREILIDLGYSVIEATDAASGFTVAAGQKPDLIMSDFLMPGIPGKNIFQELQSNAQTKNIPVIIASGMPKANIQGYIPAKLWPYILSKPLDYSLLKGYLENVLEQHKASPALFSSLFTS
ncbi:MAG: response regulator [Elusimicrobiota bacterium]